MQNCENNINAPIGMFDSGLGGLTVLREIEKICPNEDVIYIGDEAHFPYGEKTVEQIRQYSLEICKNLESQGVKLIVIACNTITAAALDYISENVSVPVIGVIESGVDAVIENTKNNNVGVLATKATINSEIYQKKLLAKNSALNVVSVTAPKLVEFVENEIEMVLNSPSEDLKTAISEYCAPFKQNNCDTVIMACTHFPPLEPLLQIELGADVSLVSPSQKTAEEVAKYLAENNLQSQTPAEYKLISTGPDPNKIQNFFNSF